MKLGPWRLTHVESPAPWLRDLRASLAGASDESPSEVQVVARVSAALLDASASHITSRWRDAAFRWPMWPEELRLGFPAAGCLWPADFELLGLWLGTRQVVKRDALSEESKRARIAWWHASGLAVAEVDGVLLGALNDATLNRAVAAQRALSSDEDTASRYLGDALGYPPCCVDAYLSLGARDDAAMFDARLEEPGPPENGFLIGPLAIVSHTPCHPRCEATLHLARVLLRAMDARSPGFEARWRRVATGVWGLDAKGAAWVFSGDSAVERAYTFQGGAHEMPGFRGESLSVVGPASLPLTFRADHRRSRP